MFWYASKLGDPSLLWNEKIFLTREDTHFTAEEERFLPIILIYGSRFDMKEVTLLSRKSGPDMEKCL